MMDVVHSKQTRNNRKTARKAKMKRLFTLVVGLVLVGAAHVGVQAQEGPIDAEEVARAILRIEEVVEYQGQFGFNRVISNRSERVRGEFQMRRPEVGQAFRITKLSIGGTNIPLAAPRASLPINVVGIAANFYMSVDGFGANRGDSLIYGYFSTNLLLQGTPINIVLQPGWVKNEIEETLPIGLSAQNARVRIGDFEGGYDVYRRRFTIWTDPLVDLVGLEYEIFDGSTGTIFKVVPIRAIDAPSVPVESPVNFSYLGGVTEVLFRDGNWASFQQQKFNTNTMVDRVGVAGVPVRIPARIYMVRLEGAQLNLSYWGLAPGSVVEIREVVDRGEMPLLQRVVVPSLSNNNGNERDIMLQAGKRAVVVTVTGSLDQDQSDGFYIHFNKSFYISVPPSTGGDDGGGKG